jgi:hypothetical protein
MLTAPRRAFKKSTLRGWKEIVELHDQIMTKKLYMTLLCLEICSISEL